MKNSILILSIALVCFLGCTESKKKIDFTAKEVHLTEELTIEKGDSLVINAGTTVLLDSAVNIIAFGNVILRGTEEEPIILKGSDPVNGWGVIRCKGSCKEFLAHNVLVENGRFMSYGTNNHFRNVHFTNNRKLKWSDAMARFWYGIVDIQNCKVTGNNQGEGFLLHNVQKPLIKNCKFFKTPDAIEYIDCKHGKILNNEFINSGDDAIDQNSCFKTLIANNIIINARDCGMELGSEKFGSSDSLQVFNNFIADCKKGIIVKESSMAMISQNTFLKNKTSVEVKTNKDSTRVSTVTLDQNIFTKTENQLEISPRSTYLAKNNFSEKKKIEGLNYSASSIDINKAQGQYSIDAKIIPRPLTKMTIGYNSNNE